MDDRRSRHGDSSRHRVDGQNQYPRGPGGGGGSDFDRNPERQRSHRFPPEQPTARRVRSVGDLTQDLGADAPTRLYRPAPATHGEGPPPNKKQKLDRPNRDFQTGRTPKRENMGWSVQDSNSTPIPQPRLQALSRDEILYDAIANGNGTIRVVLQSGEGRIEFLPRCTPDVMDLIASTSRLPDADAAFAYEPSFDLTRALGERVAGQAELQNARAYSEDEVPIGTIINHVDLEPCQDFNPNGKNARDPRRTTVTPHGVVFHGAHQKIVVSYSTDLYGHVVRECRKIGTGGGTHLTRSQKAWKEDTCATAIVISKDEPVPPEVDEEAPDVPRLLAEFDGGRQPHVKGWGAVDFGVKVDIDCRTKVEILGRLTTEAMAQMETHMEKQRELDAARKSATQRKDKISKGSSTSVASLTEEGASTGSLQSMDPPTHQITEHDEAQTQYANAGAADEVSTSDNVAKESSENVVLSKSKVNAQGHDSSTQASKATPHSSVRVDSTVDGHQLPVTTVQKETGALMAALIVDSQASAGSKRKKPGAKCIRSDED